MYQVQTDFGIKHSYELLNSAGGLTSCRLECRADAETVAEGIKRLINASPEEQKKWRWEKPEHLPPSLTLEQRTELIPIMYHQGQSDLGLMRRERKVNEVTREVEDAKWLFHYKLELRKVLQASGVNMEEYRPFLDALESLLRKGVAIWDMAMDSFDIPHPKSRMALRCALYDPPTEENAVAARCHYDRNDGTIHFAESHAGLLTPDKETFALGKEPRVRVLPRASHDLVHMFVSAKLTYMDAARFKPVWHGGMAGHVGEHRWVLVGFYHRDDHEFLPNSLNLKDHDSLARLVRDSNFAPVSSR